MNGGLQLVGRDALRILAKAEPDGEHLILRVGNPKDGRPRVSVSSRSRLATRVIWECFKGPIPPGRYVTQKKKCGRRNCIKLEHLKLSEPADASRARWGDADKRFDAKVQPGPGVCLVWTGSNNFLSHPPSWFAWRRKHGTAVPEGKELHRTCTTVGCVNPGCHEPRDLAEGLREQRELAASKRTGG